jgi:hypothetical protein
MAEEAARREQAKRNLQEVQEAMQKKAAGEAVESSQPAPDDDADRVQQ